MQNVGAAALLEQYSLPSLMQNCEPLLTLTGHHNIETREEARVNTLNDETSNLHWIIGDRTGAITRYLWKELLESLEVAPVAGFDERGNPDYELNKEGILDKGELYLNSVHKGEANGLTRHPLLQAVFTRKVITCRRKLFERIIQFGYLYLGDLQNWKIYELETIELNLRHWADNTQPWGGVKVYGYGLPDLALLQCKAFYRTNICVHLFVEEDNQLTDYLFNTAQSPTLSRKLLGHIDAAQYANALLVNASDGGLNWDLVDVALSFCSLDPAKLNTDLRWVPLPNVPDAAYVATSAFKQFYPGMNPNRSLRPDSARLLMDQRGYYTARYWGDYKYYYSFPGKSKQPGRLQRRDRKRYLNDPRKEYGFPQLEQMVKPGTSRTEVTNQDITARGYSHPAVRDLLTVKAYGKHTWSPSIVTPNSLNSNNESNVVFTGVIDLDIDDVLKYNTEDELYNKLYLLARDYPYLVPQLIACSGGGIHFIYILESPLVGRVVEVRNLGKKIKNLLMSIFDGKRPESGLTLTGKHQNQLPINQMLPVACSLTKKGMGQSYAEHNLGNSEEQFRRSQSYERIPYYMVRGSKFSLTDLKCLYSLCGLPDGEADADWGVIDDWSRKLSTWGVDALGVSSTSFPDINFSNLIYRLVAVSDRTPKLTVQQYKAMRDCLIKGWAIALRAGWGDYKLKSRLKKEALTCLTTFFNNALTSELQKEVGVNKQLDRFKQGIRQAVVTKRQAKKVQETLHSFIVSHNLPILTGAQLKDNGVKTVKQELLNALYHLVVDRNGGTVDQFIQEYLRLITLNPGRNIWYTTDFDKYPLEKRLLPLEQRKLCWFRYCYDKDVDTSKLHIVYSTRRGRRAYQKTCSKVAECFLLDKLAGLNEDELTAALEGGNPSLFQECLNYDCVAQWTKHTLTTVAVTYKPERAYALMMEQATQAGLALTSLHKKFLYQVCKQLGEALTTRHQALEVRTPEAIVNLKLQRDKIRRQLQKGIDDYQDFVFIQTLLEGTKYTRRQFLAQARKNSNNTSLSAEAKARRDAALKLLTERYGWRPATLQDKGRLWKRVGTPYGAKNFYTLLYTEKASNPA